MLPDWLWNPTDNWARFKGFGRIALLLGAILYTVGLLGMRKAVENERKGQVVSVGDVRRALDHVDELAAEHNAEYAAGMRHARVIVETELMD